MKKHLMKVAVALVALGWVGSATPSVHADQMTLQDLLNGASITVGNTLFTNFSNFSSTATGTLAVDPSQVFVIPTINGGKFGLTFQSNGQFEAGTNQFLSTHFEFNVIARPPTLLHSAGLEFTASAHADSSGQITGTLDNNLPGLSVRTTTPFDHSQSLFPTGKDRLHVGMDIRLTGGLDAEAIASMDSFTFYVAQPEPATITLLGIGAVGLVGYRWRRSRRVAV